jgi:DNA mismatch endonuclease, patch repair protein
MSRWNPRRPDDQAWRPQTGASAAARSAEQDRSAGGRAARAITISDNEVVVGSVCLRVPAKGRRVYAYLRWSHGGRTHERYVGQVAELTREANLAAAWRMVANHRLTSLRGAS